MFGKEQQAAGVFVYAVNNEHLSVLVIEPAFYRGQFVLVTILNAQQAGWFIDGHPIIGFCY
jgi:hypothetical protein